MRLMPKPLSSEELRHMVGTVVYEDEITKNAQGTEKRPAATLFDVAVEFKEDFLRVRLPGAIKIVCK